MQPRIGELLTRMSELTEHDVEEILHEQLRTRRRFGHIALEWGFCAPQHVWQAWCMQLIERREHVDLEEIGIDTQAIAEVPPELAHHCQIVPLRLFEDELIVARCENAPANLEEYLRERLGRNIRFVLADEKQIKQSLVRYYPSHILY